jgi:hypothetical protein
MKLLIFIILGLATIGGLPAATPTPNAIPDEALKVLRSHNSATFYSLEPWERPNPEDKTLHGYKILGKTTLDPKNEQVVEGAFEKAVSNWDGMIANCFDPRHALSLSSSGHIYDFLLCYNCHQLYIYKDDKVIASMGAAGSPKFLNSILAAAHVPVSQTDTEEQQAAEQKKFQEDNARWLAVMPKSLQPSWNARSSDPFPNIFPLREPLTKEYPDVTQRILKLLEWYGSGAGPWSGYPSYEDTPAKLLHDYTTQKIVTAIQSTTLNEAQIEGAARFFASWDFSQSRPGDLALLPATLKRTLLEHSLKSKDTDKKERAKAAFD